MATLKEKAAQKLKELKAKAMDKGNQRKVKEEIKKRFAEARDLLKKVEAELRKPENRRKAEEKIKSAKAKLNRLKTEFLKRQTQAKAYTEKNPEKALAVAAAAGALVGALWMAIKRKK